MLFFLQEKTVFTTLQTKLNFTMQSILLFVVAITLLQVSGLSAQDSHGSPVNVPIAEIPGHPDMCSADVTETARGNVRAEIEQLLQQQAAISLSRPCGCGAAIEGWRRVAFVNMTDSTQTCPGQWSLRSTPKRTCERNVTNGCSAASFSSGGQTYNEVCGRVIGYQRGTTDALWHPINLPQQSHPDNASQSNTVYDGGVLITHGNIPRQHIWSLFSALRRRYLSMAMTLNLILYLYSCRWHEARQKWVLFVSGYQIYMLHCAHTIWLNVLECKSVLQKQPTGNHLDTSLLKNPSRISTFQLDSVCTMRHVNLMGQLVTIIKNTVETH